MIRNRTKKKVLKYKNNQIKKIIKTIRMIINNKNKIIIEIKL